MAADIRTGQIRVPRGAKRFFPTTKANLDPRRTHHHPNLTPEQTTIYGCEPIVTLPSQRGRGDRQVEPGLSGDEPSFG